LNKYIIFRLLLLELVTLISKN